MQSRTVVRAAALFLLLVPAQALADDPYADFRVPESSGFRWLVNGNFSRNSDVQSDASQTARGNSYAPNLSTDLGAFHETDASAWNLSLRTFLRWSRRHDRSAGRTFEVSTSEGSSRFDAQGLQTSWGQAWYPGASRYSLIASASLSTDFSQSISTRDTREEFSDVRVLTGDMFATRHYGERSSWTLGAGVGRVRSVDGVYDAWDIERKLQANGRLQRPLSTAARTRLAQLSYAGSGLFYAHERSSKYYWRELERILHEDGAPSVESLDAYALERLFEGVRPGSKVRRMKGISVVISGSLDADHGHDDRDRTRDQIVFQADTLYFNSQNRSSQRFRIDRDEFLAGIDVNLQRPVGYRWQLGVRSNARYGAGRKRTTRLTTLAQAGWSIADRWSASSTVQHSAASSRVDGVGHPPRWAFSWDNSLDYWLEDAWSLSLSYSVRQEQFSFSVDDSAPRNYLRNGFIGLGFTYRPAGRFAMPELGIAEHLVPGTR
ncbi:MAG: hypothetical protein ABL977_09040 [Candidatus Eisenbacteria bacterium]